MGPAGMRSRKELFDQLCSSLAFWETQMLQQTPPIPNMLSDHCECVWGQWKAGSGKGGIGHGVPYQRAAAKFT